MGGFRGKEYVLTESKTKRDHVALVGAKFYLLQVFPLRVSASWPKDGSYCAMASSKQFHLPGPARVKDTEALSF